MDTTTLPEPPQRGDATLVRTAFRTSRLLDFCSRKELTTQTGHDENDWPLVVLKELLDNALDACEDAGVSPDIQITVNADEITVTDNGPGIPTDTIDGVLNFATRVSSREAYASPTRGAQGNALQTILAMPFVLSGNGDGRVDISARGERHEIELTLDQLRQQPVVRRQIREVDVRTGTTIRVSWPTSASSILCSAETRFLQLASDYTFLNPHLTLTVDWFGQSSRTTATAPQWEKWLPSDPTSPHWYREEDLERLIGAYVSHDGDRANDRPVREFVAEFRGLSATAKQKAVLDATGMARTNLSALVKGESLDCDAIRGILAAMQQHSRPVKPEMLGVIGKEHLEQRFTDLGCAMESFQYKKLAYSQKDGLPLVVEAAFAWRGDGCQDVRRLVTGVNWSPGIVNPFRGLGSAYYDGLAALLEKRHAGGGEPIVFLLHCVCPRVRYTDRGKSAVVMD